MAHACEQWSLITISRTRQVKDLMSRYLLQLLRGKWKTETEFMCAPPQMHTQTENRI